jgi:hypothetical protein
MTRSARLRELLTTGLEVAGAAGVVAGVNVLIGLGAALVVGGLFAMAAGYLLGGDR